MTRIKNCIAGFIRILHTPDENRLYYFIWLCLVLILFLYATFLLLNTEPAAIHADTNGYWAQGSLLSQKGRTWFTPESDVQFIGIHWQPTGDGRYVSQYPPGLSVLVAIFYKFFSPKMTYYINPLLALLSLIGIFMIIRYICYPSWGLIGVLFLALNQTYNEHAFSAISHMAVLFCLVLGLYFLLSSADNGRLWHIFVAGFLFGCIPTVRYPETLFTIGLVIFILWKVYSGEKSWKYIFAAATGFILPLLPMLIHNQFLFGGFYHTGYSLINERTGFGWVFFTSHYFTYIKMLFENGLGLIFVLGVIGMIWMSLTSGCRQMGILLIIFVVPITMLYMAYSLGMGRHGNAPLRYLLPTFPCYVIAGVYVIQRITKSRSLIQKSAIVIIIISLQYLMCGGDLANVKELPQKMLFVRSTRLLEQHVPYGSVVMANQRILHHLDFVRHWRLAYPVTLSYELPGQSGFNSSIKAHSKDFITIRCIEKLEKRWAKYIDLSAVERERKLSFELYQWAGTDKVYYIGIQSEIDSLNGICLNRNTLTPIAREQLPAFPHSIRERYFLGSASGFPALFRPGKLNLQKNFRNLYGLINTFCNLGLQSFNRSGNATELSESFDDFRDYEPINLLPGDIQNQEQPVQTQTFLQDGKK